MFLRYLTVQGFRNIEKAELEFNGGTNVFYGDNAQGKTNALEAIFLLSATKSFRKAKDSDLIRFGEDHAFIKGVYTENGTDEEIKIEFEKEGRKKIFIDSMPLEKNSYAVGRLLTVIFTPDHLSLVKFAPEERRRFLDLALCQSSPVLLRDYKDYNRIISQKNSLIRSYKEKGICDFGYFEILNEKLSVLCANIAIARSEICESLSFNASKAYNEMTKEKEELSFEYKKSAKEAVLKEDLIKEYCEILNKKLNEELSAGFCTQGIHRDDVRIMINGKSVREFASQGQQRSVVLSMKLAEGEYISLKRGSMPVFLFDDLLSELDSKRREYILEKISGKQVIISSCNEEFHKDSAVNKYLVKNGNFYKK